MTSELAFQASTTPENTAIVLRALAKTQCFWEVRLEVY